MSRIRKIMTTAKKTVKKIRQELRFKEKWSAIVINFFTKAFGSRWSKLNKEVPVESVKLNNRNDEMILNETIGKHGKE